MQLPPFLESTRNRIIAGAVAGVLLLGGIVLALAAGGGEEAAPTTTTTTTTTSTTTTTTTAPPPPPVFPLTGLPDDGSGRATRPALVVKIDNVEPKARNQAGLNEADVVYEERVEGSVTRLLAIFHSTDAAPVGPVRSARSSDIAIFSPLNRPYFAWSGANPTFAELVRASNVNDVGYDVQPGYYFRDGGRPRPSNLMANGTADLLAIPSEGSGAPPPLFTYLAAGEAPAHLEPVAGVRVTYGNLPGAAPVEYHWNGTGWARFQNGTPHTDAAGVQVAPANVIVQFTSYIGSGTGDQFGNDIPEAQTVGEGEAWVLTQGGLIPAKWSKPAPEVPTTYTNLIDGAPVKLSPGRTWVALPPPGEGARL